MKNFLPFMLIKAVLTAALFGGIPGVPRGMIKAKADDVQYFELYSNNQIFLLSEDTFISEMTSYRSPASPKDSTVRFADADATTEMSFEDIQLSGTTGSGSSQRDNVDISDARITLESSDKNYVVQLILYGRTSPEVLLEDQNYFFYISSGTKILSLPLQQIFGSLDLSKWWLLSAQLHEETRPGGYSDWDSLPFATPVPINTEALYFSSRYIEFLVPEYNYLAGFNPSLYYHTSWGLMTCGNANVVTGDLPTEASFTLREPTHIKVGTTQRNYFPFPSAYGIPQTYPADTSKIFLYVPTDSSVVDTNTNTIYPTGAVFESPRLRFVLVDFLAEEIDTLYAGESQDDLVAGYNGQNIAAFDFFRVCCPANITLPPSPPEPEPEPEPGLGLKSDFSTWNGSLSTFLVGAATIILTGIYVVPSIVAGISLAVERGENFEVGVLRGLQLFVQFFKESWNWFFDAVSPIINAIAKVIDAVGDFFVRFVEKIAPSAKKILDWIFAFIGNYWYVILPVAIAIFVTVQIQKNRRR